MSFESPIVLPPVEKPRDAQEALEREVAKHLSAFSEDVRKFVKMWIEHRMLTFAEQKRVQTAVDKWWMEVYGFPFSHQNAREQELMRKYAEPETESMKLFRSLLLAVERQDEEEIERLKAKYIGNFQEELEGVEVLFGIRDFLRKQRTVAALQEEWKRGEGPELSDEVRMNLFRELTEYQFLFTHYILFNSTNKKFMEIFWQAAETMAVRAGFLKEFKDLRAGQISQVAVFKILEQLGRKPKLSHPEDDAFRAIDLWTEDHEAFQIKGWQEDVPAVVESDHVSFPAASVDEPAQSQRTYYHTVDLMRKHDLFRAKVERYGRHIGRKIRSYFFVVPYPKIDPVTGEPSAELVDFFREEMKKRQNGRTHTIRRTSSVSSQTSL